MIEVIINRVLIALVVIFILSKFIYPMLLVLWKQFFAGKRRNSVDIEVLIERQKALMRGEVVKKGPSQSKAPKTTNATTKAYQNHFRQSTSEDSKKVLALFDNLQWGEGKDFANISRKLKEKFFTSIDIKTVVSSCKRILQKDILLSRQTKALPTYEEIVQVVELQTILTVLLEESLKGGGELLNSLGKRWRMKSLDLIKAFTALLYLPEKVDKKILQGEIVLKKSSSSSWEDKIISWAKTEDGKFFRSSKDFLNQLIQKGDFFSTLSPLRPPKDKKDIQRAREIFYADSSTPLEEIKKRYKKLAKQKHPDKLVSKGIPPEFTSIANKNFAIIKDAYDIILSTNH